jgi:hypothetical protein
MRVIVHEPTFERLEPRQRAGPFVQPDTFLLQGAHHPFGVGVACGVVIAGTRRPHAQGTAGLHQSHRGGLTAVIAQQRALWRSHPPGNGRFTAMSEAARHCRAVQGRPASRPTSVVVYQSSPSPT